MKIYKIDGREDPVKIFTDQEEMDFLEEAKSKNLNVNLITDTKSPRTGPNYVEKKDNLGNQPSSTGGATVEQDPTAQVQQNNYLESKSDPGSLDFQNESIKIQQTEIYQLEEDLNSDYYKDQFGQLKTNLDNYSSQMNTLEEEMKKISEAKYYSQDEVDLAKLNVEKNQIYHETIREKYNTIIKQQEALSSDYNGLVSDYSAMHYNAGKSVDAYNKQIAETTKSLTPIEAREKAKKDPKMDFVKNLLGVAVETVPGFGLLEKTIKTATGESIAGTTVDATSGVGRGLYNWITGNLTEIEEDTDKETQLYKNVETVLGPDNMFTDIVHDMINAQTNGWTIGESVDSSQDVFQVASKGKIPKNEDILRMIEDGMTVNNLHTTDEVKAYQKIYDENKEKHGGTAAWFQAIVENPSFLATTMVESMAMMASTAYHSDQAQKKLATNVPLAAGTAAVAIPFLPDEIITAPAAAMYTAFGTLSGVMEQGLTFKELLQEELKNRNLEFTPENVKALLSDTRVDTFKDPRFSALDITGTPFEIIKTKANRRGNTIGFIDGIGAAITGGSVRRMSSKAFKAGELTKKEIAKKITMLETPKAIGFGLASEVGGQTAGGQEYDIGEILTEGFAEKGMAISGITVAPEVLKQVTKKQGTYSIEGETMSEKEFLRRTSKMSDIELAMHDIKIENDKARNTQIQNKRLRGIIDSQVDTRVEDVKDRKKIVDQELKILQIKNKLKQKDLPESTKEILNEELKTIKENINSITEKYSKVDRRTRDVKAREKAKKEAPKKWKDISLSKTLKLLEDNKKFVNKTTIVADEDGDAQAIQDMIAEEYGIEAENVEGSDAYIVGDYIVVNKAIAGSTGQINVGGHELLHGVLEKYLGSLSGEKKTDLIKSWRKTLTKEQEQYIEKEINRRISKGEELDIKTTDEWFTIFSDGITKEDITFNEGTFSKIKNGIQDIFRSMYPGWKKEFADGQQAYSFMKDYQASIKEGKFSERVKKMAEGGTTTRTTKRSVSGIDPDVDVGPDINDMAEAYETEGGNKLWENEGHKIFMDSITEEGALDNLIFSATSIPIPPMLQEKFKNDVYAELTSHVRNYKPERNLEYKQENPDDATGLFGWINPQLKNKVLNVQKRPEYSPDELSRAKDITEKTEEGAPRYQTADTALNPEEQMIAEEQGLLEVKEKGDFVKDKLNFSEKTNKAINDIVKEVDYDVNKLYEDVKQDIISQENPNEKSKNRVEPTGELYPVIEAVSSIEYDVDPRAVLAKPQNLTSPESRSARTRIAEDAKRLGPKEFVKSILPQFNFNPKSGKSIGLNTGVLKSFYIGSEVRVPNIKGQALNVDNMTDAEILAPFGINPDFTLMPQDRAGNFDGPVKGVIVQSSAFAANQSARVIKGKPDASISIGKPRTMFSKSVNDVLNIRDLFELETKGIDKLLSSYGISNTFNIRTEQGRKQFVEAIENELLPLMPKDFWFGKDSTVFTASNKAYGLSMSKPNEAKAYSDLRNKIKALKNKKGVKFGKEIKGVKDYSVSSYNTLFRSPSVIEANIKNGKIKAFNKKVSIIHKEMWKRFNNAISKDNNKASIIGTYLKLVANDTNHWHKLGAQFVGYSKKITGARVEYEHAMPATAAYLYLIDSALSESNFDASYKLVTDNYKLIALDKAMDKKLTSVKLQRRMPTGWSVIDNNWWDRYFNSNVGSVNGGINPNSIIGLDGKTFGETFNVNADGKPAIIKKSQSEIKNINNAIEAFNKQAKLIKKQNKELQADLEKRGYKFADMDNKGMSTFDFDETLIIDGENFVVATDPKTGETLNIKSGDWPVRGPELAAAGYTFNFDDFVNVRGGVDGPLLQKMKNQIEKYGTENVFILTARPQTADVAIHEWLKSKGINIPFKNITGLAKSEGQAKADWMLEKFAEGYNDMYFVDDALPNVKAVKDVLEQLDIKSKVVQAKIKFSKSAPLDFDKILEQSKGVLAGKKFSVAEARKRGLSKGRFKFFIPPSAEDFKGLLYSFLGKGKEGDAHMRFFKENLLDPYANGYRKWNTYKQAMADDYALLKKKFPNVSKILNDKVKGTSFTNDTAVRVYLWNKAGFEIPGISKTLQDKLVKQVDSNPELKAFAEALSVVSRRPEGYIEPSSYWTAQTIGSDLNSIVGTVGRKEFLSEWIENKNIIFNEENLNKIEAIYGDGFRDALENMLYRMETGTNRAAGKDKITNKFLNWINGSVGATMFWNMRSAVLQTISTVNFINWGDNNVFKAAKAFANQPQYWKDFAFIFNSPMLKQRRAGLQIDVSASELTRAFADGRSKTEAVIAYLLEKGFTPTKMADSFAIALGGSTFYRNRLNTYVKQGMSETKAKEQAFLDFQEVAEETQQSSRPDLISMQQAGVLGRIILAWQNTPMQMTRLTKKAMSDLVNRRGNDKANISKIIYYGVAQNVIFGALQTGLMFMLFGNDEDEERKKQLELRVANGAFDTLLRGTGVYGAAIATLKNVLLKWKEESKKGWKRENMNIAQAAVDLSPPMGSKLRKIMQAVRTEEYNKGVSKEIGFRIENPNLSIAANWTEALTNIPVARTINKMNNVEEALTGNLDVWQRVALASGWSKWSIGIKDEELEQAKADAKEARRIKRDKEKAIKKEEEKKLKAEEKKKVEEKKKEEGIKKVRCSATKSNGQRCSMIVETKAKSARCMYHKTYDEKEGSDMDGDGNKEFRCTAKKSNGQQCKNRTENKNKKCYAHQ